MSPRKSLSPEKRKPYSSKKISLFAKNVQARRLALGISQVELGKTLGVSQTRISEIEGGIFPSDPARIIALARALKTDPNTLLGFEKEGE